MKKILAAMALILCFAASATANAVHKNIALIVAGSGKTQAEPELVKLCGDGLKMAKNNYMRSISVKLYNLKDYASKTEVLERASSWANMVIIPVPDFMEELKTVIKNHENVVYVAFDEVPNARIINFRDEETGFMAGVLAALYAKNNKDSRIKSNSRIGAIFGPENPAIKRMKLGFRTGLWYISKNIDPLIVHTEDFFNREAAASLAKKMHERGVDIIFTASGDAGLGAIEIAEKEGFWTIGVDAEVERKYPKAVLASAVKRFDYVVFAAIDMYMQNKLDINYLSLGVKEGAIGLSTWTRESKSNVPLSIRKQAEEIEDKLEKGFIILPKFDKNKH